MAVVARTRQRELVLQGRGTILAQCLASGLPVASACSGRGACGKCLITVIQGAESLAARSTHEQAVLARNGGAPDQRLSCQCALPSAAGEVLITTGYW